MFKTETLTNWDEIHDYSSRKGWLFRGQRCAKWNLETSLERCCDRHGISCAERRPIEDRLFREFRRSYYLYASHVPDSKAVVEWFSLMQHHGAPTRLLDFTYSVYIAAYFAVEAADAESAVWALDGRWAMNRAMALLRKEKNANHVHRMTEAFQEGDEKKVSNLFFKPPYVSAAWPINAFRLNERLRIQRGVFLICGDISQSFMTNLSALDEPGDQDHLIKIVIPPAQVRRAIKQLFAMNISRTSLFPGLDGYASVAGCMESCCLRPS